jgi:hypothetical protein
VHSNESEQFVVSNISFGWILAHSVEIITPMQWCCFLSFGCQWQGWWCCSVSVSGEGNGSGIGGGVGVGDGGGFNLSP